MLYFNAKFCRHCGKKIVTFCPDCGTKVDVTAEEKKKTDILPTMGEIALDMTEKVLEKVEGDNHSPHFEKMRNAKPAQAEPPARSEIPAKPQTSTHADGSVNNLVTSVEELDYDKMLSCFDSKTEKQIRAVMGITGDIVGSLTGISIDLEYLMDMVGDLG